MTGGFALVSGSGAHLQSPESTRHLKFSHARRSRRNCGRQYNPTNLPISYNPLTKWGCGCPPSVSPSVSLSLCVVSYTLCSALSIHRNCRLIAPASKEGGSLSTPDQTTPHDQPIHNIRTEFRCCRSSSVVIAQHGTFTWSIMSHYQRTSLISRGHGRNHVPRRMTATKDNRK